MTKRLAPSLLFAFALVLAAAVPGIAPEPRPAEAAVDSSTETWPAKATVCGDASILDGPAEAPAGAVVVPAGDNAGFWDWPNVYDPGTTFYFETGTHTLDASEYASIGPKTGDTYIGAPGAVLDGAKINRYAFTGQAENVTIAHLTITGFVAPGTEGTINGSASPGWTIRNNTIADNNASGVFTGSGTVIVDNCITSNGAHGISGYRPAVAVGHGPSAITDIQVLRNEVSHHPRDAHFETNPDGTETQCGCTGGMKFWDTGGAHVAGNWLHHNTSPALWADTNNVDFLIEDNHLSDNAGEAIWYEISYNATIRNNVLLRNNWGKGAERAGQNFPDGAVYIAESGGEPRVSPNHNTLTISGNYFEDNWGGVALWEAAERFCASPGNTSAGYCTKVNPDINHDVCGDMDLLANEPYYSDCRWLTQNVLVTGNEFHMDLAAMPAACTDSPNCGNNGLFGHYGSDYPAGTPYTGWVVADRLTFESNNVFEANTYVGDGWKFTGHDKGTKLTFEEWQAAPYHQDAGSTLNGSSSTTTTTSSTTTTTAPAEETVNRLDFQTSTITDNVGQWTPWWSATVTRRLNVNNWALHVEAGSTSTWGVTLANWPGFDAAPGPHTVSYWASNDDAATAELKVVWRDASGNTLGSDVVSADHLFPGFGNVSADVVAPEGTAKVWLELTGSGLTSTQYLFDNFAVAG